MQAYLHQDFVSEPEPVSQAPELSKRLVGGGWFFSGAAQGPFQIVCNLQQGLGKALQPVPICSLDSRA